MSRRRRAGVPARRRAWSGNSGLSTTSNWGIVVGRGPEVTGRRRRRRPVGTGSSASSWRAQLQYARRERTPPWRSRKSPARRRVAPVAAVSAAEALSAAVARTKYSGQQHSNPSPHRDHLDAEGETIRWGSADAAYRHHGHARIVSGGQNCVDRAALDAAMLAESRMRVGAAGLHRRGPARTAGRCARPGSGRPRPATTSRRGAMFRDSDALLVLRSHHVVARHRPHCGRGVWVKVGLSSRRTPTTRTRSCSMAGRFAACTSTSLACGGRTSTWRTPRRTRWRSAFGR